ncbi:Plant transposase (Ptta/En/Spm family) [Carex littledalei]|uniref:Plant transposase (Ptta/En/Spm family) n=1 Tax=Carex littledalei TaxID=544730 RepID=A0A833VDJ2_9POAL|nr:Plant transposase (Ptta/En/Spm family) [Carex littledalei]
MADNADKDAGSQSEGAVRRQPPRFTKRQIIAKKPHFVFLSHPRPPPPSYREEPKLPPLWEGSEIDATVAPPNPEPVAQPPPHPPSDAPPHTPNPTVPPPNPSPVAPPPLPSDAPQSKPPPPNTSEVVATVPSPNPPSNPPPKKSVRGRAKRNSSSMVRPLRRSLRLNPLSTLLQDEPTDKDVSCVATADVSQPLEHSVTAADVQIDGSEPFVEPREPEPELAAPLVQPGVEAPSLKIFWGPNPGVMKRSRPSQSHPEPSQPLKARPSKSEPTRSMPTAEVHNESDDTIMHTESLPSSTTSSPQPEAGDSDWSYSSQTPFTQETEAETSEINTCSEEESAHPAVNFDDGGKRTLRRRPLRNCDEAKEANNRELDEESARGAEVKTTGKRKRAGKSEVRRGRGMAKPRKPAAPGARPELMVVGDAEFTSTPICTKVVSTVRILTLENMPGPYRTYNMFPIKARLEILKKFLQRYSWGEGEDVQRCLDVFERIASEAYYSEMTHLRKKYTSQYGKDKEVWKDFPPQWCKNPGYWKGLCLIWSKEKFDKISTTNRNNKKKGGKIIHHVAGSISSFRHAQKLASEKGSSVGLKEVFDRMHLKDSDAGKVYVNEKAEAKMKCFEDLKRNYGGVMSEESLWELAVDGEDRRGRLFGFGNRSRISKVNQALAAEDATMSDPAKSTATSAVDENERFTRSQVANLIASKLADERRAFAAEIAAQEKRHKEELAIHKKNDEYNKTCLAALFRATGAPLPPPNEGTSKGHDGEGNNGGGEGPHN